MKKILSGAAFAVVLFLLTTNANAQAKKNFTINNKTGVTVTSICVSPSGKNNWSANICNKNGISNNSAFDFRWPIDVKNSKVDVKFLGNNGHTYYLKNIDLSNESAISLLIPKGNPNERAHQSSMRK